MNHVASQSKHMTAECKETMMEVQYFMARDFSLDPRLYSGIMPIFEFNSIPTGIFNRNSNRILNSNRNFDSNRNSSNSNRNSSNSNTVSFLIPACRIDAQDICQVDEHWYSSNDVQNKNLVFACLGMYHYFFANLYRTRPH